MPTLAPAMVPEPQATEGKPRRRSSLAEKLEEKVEKLLHRSPATASGDFAKHETEAHHHKIWRHMGKERKEVAAGEGVVVPPVERQAQVH